MWRKWRHLQIWGRSGNSSKGPKGSKWFNDSFKSVLGKPCSGFAAVPMDPPYENWLRIQNALFECMGMLVLAATSLSLSRMILAMSAVSSCPTQTHLYANRLIKIPTHAIEMTDEFDTESICNQIIEQNPCMIRAKNRWKLQDIHRKMFE